MHAKILFSYSLFPITTSAIPIFVKVQFFSRDLILFRPTPYTLHPFPPTPYTLHPFPPTPYTLHPTPIPPYTPPPTT